MIESKKIRDKFKEFFESKGHKIVPSAPMVIKGDPTLMFTNAGMNQFKDIFLGNSAAEYKRVANSQKCLRVSGKHNDLGEVGHDTYHHTMFEMLGNWSFGDYFKEEAVDWAWEFLTGWMKIDPERIYATVFEGDREDNLDKDEEAYNFWLKHLDKSRILNGSKKDNFWEMGDTGPCGPCSEIHLDLRTDEERNNLPGTELVNKDHPLVIEIWNLVFIQYNRKVGGKLENLPESHVDTGMGFERLCMALQGKTSNYDTDIFQPLILKISEIAGIKYKANEKTDIAMRVIADHIRAISFSIAEGQLPSNTGAGYVIRRILRRAVRYAYTFLNLGEPFMAKLLPALSESMSDAFPELKSQMHLVEKVVTEEESTFLRTLESGIKRLEQIIDNMKGTPLKVVDGKQAFELYDTYGFPLDLTELILHEKGYTVNLREFDKEMEKQKSRSRSAAEQETSDWIMVNENETEGFLGHEHLSSEVKIVRFRQVTSRNNKKYQLVFNNTPFYAESGGQVGDTGYIEKDGEKIWILDTQKENNVIIHITEKLPADPSGTFRATVNSGKRSDTKRNHTATHLLHHALRKVLGEHVEQKGSLVNEKHLRFDFSHYEKPGDDAIRRIEKMVNQLIRADIRLEEHRGLPMDEALDMGAIALFGEKYGEKVRVIRFGDSVELCGGTHVDATGEIGFFKIISEGSIAAGIRRIEAITGIAAEEWVYEKTSTLDIISSLFKNSTNLLDSVNSLMEENSELKKKLEGFEKDRVKSIKSELLKNIDTSGDIEIIKSIVDINDAGQIRDLAFQLRGERENLVLILGAVIKGKPNLSIMISDNLVSKNGWDAGKTVREAARKIQGGGGGQPFYATAGGKNPDGLQDAVNEAYNILFKGS
jgi:alanyl-tRNA synthetase